MKLDSTKLKDSGKDFEAIFEDFYSSEGKEKRQLQRNRQEREKNNKEDRGL